MLERAPPWTMPGEEETPHTNETGTAKSNYQEQSSAFICQVFINRSELSNSTGYLTDAHLYF